MSKKMNKKPHESPDNFLSIQNDFSNSDSVEELGEKYWKYRNLLDHLFARTIGDISEKNKQEGGV